MRKLKYSTRILLSFLISLVLLVPGLVGAWLIKLDPTPNRISLQTMTGTFLVIGSLFWFFKRFKFFISSAETTTELNLKFEQRLSKQDLVLSGPSSQFYFRRYWTFLVSPLLIFIISLFFSHNANFSWSGLAVGIFISLIADFLVFASSPLIWYSQKQEILTKFFMFFPIARLKISNVRAYSWIGRGYRGPVFERLQVFDLSLQELAILPVKAYPMEVLLNDLTSQATEIPSSLNL